jgi:four helix bundle protein
MAAFKSVEDIEAWQRARELTRQIYTISNRGSFSKDFGLRDQIRRASVSIMSNIAEGYERSGTGEFVQFLAIAKGSVGEVVSHIYVAKDQGYVSKEDFDHVFTLSKQTARIISGLMSYLRKSGIKGTKYK